MIQYLQILLNARRDDERGASAVEYGLLVSLIALAIIVAVGLLGTELDALFDRVTAGI